MIKYEKYFYLIATLIFIFSSKVIGQWNRSEYLQYLKYSNPTDSVEALTFTDKNPPLAPVLTLDTLGYDSIQITLDFRGDATLDSFFVRGSDVSFPSFKTSGTEILIGAIGDTVNEIHFPYALAGSHKTYYVRTFVQDTVPNITYRSVSKTDPIILDTLTAPTDSVPISIANVGQPIPQEVAITYYPHTIYDINPPTISQNPYGYIWVYISYTGFFAPDSELLAIEDFDDILLDSTQTYTHAPAEDIWVWSYLKSAGGNRCPNAATDSVVNAPADVTPPDIAGVFSVDVAPLQDLIIAEGSPYIHSTSADFSYFSVYIKTNASDNYFLIDTIGDFQSYNSFTLPQNTFVYDSIYCIITATDTANNRSTFESSIKDTLGFVPAWLYITFLTGTRGQPQYYWFYRNESDSTVSDSLRIPALFVDTTLTDTCKVPVIPVDTLVQAYYALRPLTNDTLGAMSKWLKWPPDEGLPDDNTPPNIAGSFEASYDSTYHIKVYSTSVYSTSPDFNHYVIYFRSSAEDSWTQIDTANSLDVNDRFHITRTISYNDSGFVAVTAVDDSSNESTSITDEFTTTPYFLVFETLGGRRVDIDNVWVYLSYDSSAITDSFRIAMNDIDTTIYEADTILVPVSPPLNYHGRYYAGRSDSSGVLKTRSNWKWYPPPSLPDTMIVQSVSSDTVNIQVSGFPMHVSNLGTYNIRYRSGSYPSSKTDGTSLVSTTDTSAINNDNFAISGVANSTQYFRLFVSKNGEDGLSTLDDTTTFPASEGSCPSLASSYKFAWNGDYPDNNLLACNDLASFTKAGVTGGTVEINSDYGYSGNGFRKTANNEYVNFAFDSGDSLINDELGTIWMRVYIVSDGAMTNDMVFESSSNSTNFIYIIINSDKSLRGYFRDNVNQQYVVSTIGSAADTVHWNEWNWIGYSWDATNNRHCVTINDETWYQESETLDAWATQPNNVAIGEKDRGGTESDAIWIDDVYIFNTYQAARPQ